MNQIDKQSPEIKEIHITNENKDNNDNKEINNAKDINQIIHENKV